VSCQQPGCRRKARHMAGYLKWCGVNVNVQAVCVGHIPDADRMVNAILAGHSAGFATAYNRKTEAGA
jgi:hypothetical protein